MPARRVAVTGASGLIGGALAAYLMDRGDEVIRLVRREPTRALERLWSPVPGGLDPTVLEDVDAVVHLAAAGVGDHRWTPAYKELVLRSRVEGTRAVAEAIAQTARPIRFVCGSAIGYYGDRGEEVLTERSDPGTGFLAEVVRAWEAAADAAQEAGAPVAFARHGLVMAPGGGAFAKVLRLARRGLGGPLGTGRQYWSWITLRDSVRALGHLIDRPDVLGAVNVVGPDPRPQRVVAREIGKALGRPAILPAPSVALRVALGEFADDILSSQRVMPFALADSGFTFQHATMTDAAAWLTR